MKHWKPDNLKKVAIIHLKAVIKKLDNYDPDFYPTLRDKVYAEALERGWSRTNSNIIADRAMNL